MPVQTVEEAIDDIRQGKMVILVDDEDRENEGDLTMAAEKVTPEAINFMTRYGRGLICFKHSHGDSQFGEQSSGFLRRLGAAFRRHGIFRLCFLQSDLLNGINYQYQRVHAHW